MFKNIRQTIARARKYYRNRGFQRSIEREKQKKYLFERKPQKIRAPWRDIFARSQKHHRDTFSRFANTFHHFTGDKPPLAIPIVLTALILIGSSIYVLFFSPYFTISASEVVVERKDSLSDINIAYKSIENIYGQSIWFISADTISGLIRGFEKNIRTVEVSRLFPNGLKIVIDSYPPEFALVLPPPHDHYIVTANGVLAYDSDPPKNLMKLVLVDKAFIDSGFFDYRQGIAPDMMTRLISLRDNFVKKFPELSVTKVVLFSVEREAHIFLESGTVVIIPLDTSTDTIVDLVRYYETNNSNILGSGDVVYLDARDPKRFFVCSDQALCPKNLDRIYGTVYATK